MDHSFHEDPSASVALIEACGMPEIGWQLSVVSIHLDPSLDRPFRLEGNAISIQPAAAQETATAAMILREAIELHAYGDVAPSLTQRILAFSTAAVYGGTVLRAESGWRGPLTLSVDEVLGRPDDTVRRLVEELRKRDEISDEPTNREIESAVHALPLSLPTEVLLTIGGDDRQVVDWETGLNSYGISPRPTPWKTAFGSCTASSPTPRGFAAAHGLRRRLLDAAIGGELDAVTVGEADTMRAMILAALGMRDAAGVEVILTPSGTDAEFVALSVSLLGADRLTSVILAPNEIGSGSLAAAAGRHFSSRLPLGRQGDASAYLGGLSEGTVQISEVPVRDDDGKMLGADVVEETIATRLREATTRVLLHVVEGSKTGIRLPSPDSLRHWEGRLGENLDVVVDAAQMRIDQHTAIDHLEKGRMVFISGSKFFGGPPFSGAVLIPRSLAERVRSVSAMPITLSQYLTRADVPASLPPLHASTRVAANYGLLTRWAAALAEMRSFHNASPDIRDEVLRVLAAGIRQVIDNCPYAEIVESPYSRIPDRDMRGLDDLPTIFTFLVRRRDGTLLTVDQAKRLHSLLGRDISALLEEAPAVAQRSFHLGQPVKIKPEGEEWIAGLRVAVGAPTISQVIFDPARGDRWTDRVIAELADVRAAIEKLELVVSAGALV